MEKKIKLEIEPGELTFKGEKFQKDRTEETERKKLSKK